MASQNPADTAGCLRRLSSGVCGCPGSPAACGQYGKTVSAMQTLATGVSIIHNGIAATLNVDFAAQQTFSAGWNSICAIPEGLRPKSTRLRFVLIDNYASTNDDNYPIFGRIYNGDFAIYAFASRLTIQPVGCVTYVL